MGTFLFDDHIFGPIKSRRLGSSLGINLLSKNQKVCNFNCIYCECGLTKKIEREVRLFVNAEELIYQFKLKLDQCKSEDFDIDAITFAGNGEPTLHPDFAYILKHVFNLRNELYPNASIVLLSNGTTLTAPWMKGVHEYLDKLIIKLDAGEQELLNLIDQPKGRFPLQDFVQLLKAYEGDIIIQTMFLSGKVDDMIFDNSKGESLVKWIELIKEINPSEVQLYSIDRDTPIVDLKPVEKECLESIANELNKLGINTLVV